MKHHISSVTLTAAIAGLIGSSAWLQASETDSRIESTFQKTYVYRTYLKDDSITTVAKDGIVTLTGTVADEPHKRLAQDTIETLPGVTRVENQLVTKAEVVAEKADVWIARKLKWTLLFHRNVSYGATTIDVKDGVVTLNGKAASTAQKDLTSEYAKDIDGVKNVKNEMTVATVPEPPVRTMAEKIDDASVVAQVKMVLATHRATSAVKTAVEARDGVVSLTGIAANGAEKDLVTKLVIDVHGVIEVKNMMVVKSK